MSLHITNFFKRKKWDLSNNWDVGGISSINQRAECKVQTRQFLVTRKFSMKDSNLNVSDFCSTVVRIEKKKIIRDINSTNRRRKTRLMALPNLQICKSQLTLLTKVSRMRIGQARKRVGGKRTGRKHQYSCVKVQIIQISL